MENPWTKLPDEEPYVLPEDLPHIEAFNRRVAHRPEFAIHTERSTMQKALSRRNLIGFELVERALAD